MEFVPNEKATPIRYPSIANLMVDSFDRNLVAYELCNDFQINKINNILNGFFTRIGVTEVVFEWNFPNISGVYSNFGYIVNDVDYSFNLYGFFNAAELIDAIVSNANANTSATGLTWTVTASEGGGALITVSGAPGITYSLSGPSIFMLTSELNEFAGTIPTEGSDSYLINSDTVDLRRTRYIDVICNQLTNNQAVKDASTAQHSRDVLVRWYFAYDNQNPVDAYGIPILMGYAPFVLRRLYNPPKQIQWQSNIPVGNLSFQLYNDAGQLATVNPETNYLMTLQVSEN